MLPREETPAREAKARPAASDEQIYCTSLANCGFTAEELRGIDRENALRMLPRFRAA